MTYPEVGAGRWSRVCSSVDSKTSGLSPRAITDGRPGKYDISLGQGAARIKCLDRTFDKSCSNYFSIGCHRRAPCRKG